jgi:glucarate dehydratase
MLPFGRLAATMGIVTKITKVTVTPVAFASPPLLTAAGVREPYVLRAVVEVETDAGLTGLGETYGDEPHLAALDAAVAAVEGADVYRTEEIYYRVRSVIAPEYGAGPGPAMATPPGVTAVVGGPAGRGSAADRAFSPIEVACLDIQGQAAGRPLGDLLGGPVREEVRFAACLSYKWAAHPGGGAPGGTVTAPDPWGPALDPDSIVAQAKAMIDGYGFIAIGLKGGIFPPEDEIAAVHALRDAFPHHPIRLDPNAAWTPATAVQAAREMDGTLEYLEDPAPGLGGLAEVAHAVATPLASSRCVVELAHIPPAVSTNAVRVILLDHHYWGGLRRSMTLAGVCEMFGLGLSMHASPQLGISMAAQLHLAAAIPNLTYACDTHWPWKTEDVVNEPFFFADGALDVPSAPGLGVTLDADALARLHEQYLACGIRNRDDTGYLRRVDPSYEWHEGRW